MDFHQGARFGDSSVASFGAVILLPQSQNFLVLKLTLGMLHWDLHTPPLTCPIYLLNYTVLLRFAKCFISIISFDLHLLLPVLGLEPRFSGFYMLYSFYSIIISDEYQSLRI